MEFWSMYSSYVHMEFFLYGFHFCFCLANQFLKHAGSVLMPFEESALSGQGCPHVPGYEYLRWAFTVLLFFLTHMLDLYGICSAYTSFLNCRLQFTGCSFSIAQLRRVEEECTDSHVGGSHLGSYLGLGDRWHAVSRICTSRYNQVKTLSGQMTFLW